MIDLKLVRNGSLLMDFNPPVNPPKDIADPDDEMPYDWVTKAKYVL